MTTPKRGRPPVAPGGTRAVKVSLDPATIERAQQLGREVTGRKRGTLSEGLREAVRRSR